MGMQTHHSLGISKALLYDVRSMSKKGSEATKENEGTKDHWEHELQLLNSSEFFIDMVNRHKWISKTKDVEVDGKMKEVEIINKYF